MQARAMGTATTLVITKMRQSERRLAVTKYVCGQEGYAKLMRRQDGQGDRSNLKVQQ